MNSRLTIARLGAQGHGIANTERGPVFVPFTLPGEEVTAAVERDRGTLMAVTEPSPLRVPPPCRHFGECGGCTTQHLQHDAYLEWKRGRVVEAMARERIVGEIAPIIPCPPASRRRVTLSARRTERAMLLGYHQMQSHSIVDIVECPISVPAIVNALPALRALCDAVVRTREACHLTVTATRSGLDVAFVGSGPLTPAESRAAADLALRSGLARLSIEGNIVVEARQPVIIFGKATVSPPPGGFVQAVEAAEEAMASLVGKHLAGAKRIADLFAGAGAFALRLAAQSEIHAVESDGAALAALDRGFRFTPGLRRVTTERRDLFRRPLTVKELASYGGVVFDPPRAGAEDQCRQLARSDVPRVAAVSCNPTTLARDLRILVDGGYTVTQITPVDQFLWSGHVEAVALLAKPKRRR